MDSVEVTVWRSLAIVIVLLMLSRCFGGLKMEAVFCRHLEVVTMTSDIIIMVEDGVVAIEVVSSHAAVGASVVQLAVVRQQRWT